VKLLFSSSNKYPCNPLLFTVFIRDMPRNVSLAVVPTRRGRGRRGNNPSRAQQNIGAASQLIPRYADPPSTRTQALVTKRVQVNKPVTALPVVLSFNDVLPASGSWLSARVLKVSVWGPSGTPSTGTSGGNESTISITDSLTNGDGAIFTDTGVTGASRAHVCYRPTHLARLTWHKAGADTIATVTVATPSSGAESVCFEVTVEINETQ